MNSNIKLVPYVVLEKQCNPNLSGTAQLKMMFPGILSNDFDLPFLKSSDVVPLNISNHPAYQAMQIVRDLELDDISYYLLLEIVLFVQNSALSRDGYRNAKSVQNRARKMLYRYLCSKMKPFRADMYMQIIEMAIGYFTSHNDYLINELTNQEKNMSASTSN